MKRWTVFPPSSGGAKDQVIRDIVYHYTTGIPIQSLRWLAAGGSASETSQVGSALTGHMIRHPSILKTAQAQRGLLVRDLASGGGLRHLQESVPMTPKLRWHARGFVGMDVAILGGHVLVTAGDGIRCFEPEEGRLLWERSGDFGAGMVAGEAGTILARVRDSGSLGAERSRIEHLAASSGELMEAIGLDGVPVAAVGGLILVFWASEAGPKTRLFAYKTSTNEVVWQAVGGGQDFVLQTSTEVVILARGQRAEARFLSTGAVVWDTDLGLSRVSISSMAEDVLVVGDGQAIVGLDRRTGVILWRQHGWIWARAGTSGIYVANTRAVSSLDFQTGEALLPSLDLTESLRRPRGLVARLACAPVDHRGKAVVLTEDGWCIEVNPAAGGDAQAVHTSARSLLGVTPHVMGNNIVFADFSLEESHPPRLYCVSLGS